MSDNGYRDMLNDKNMIVNGGPNMQAFQAGVDGSSINQTEAGQRPMQTSGHSKAVDLQGGAKYNDIPGGST